MVDQLKQNNYVLIKGFIDSGRAKYLSSDFRKYCIQHCIPGDVQVKNSSCYYDYPKFKSLLLEKKSHVEKIVGRDLSPSYSYARVYRYKNILSKHVDRFACEISATLHLDGDQPWDFYIETPEKKEVSITLNRGDAIIYLGRIAPHWRHEYYGEFYTQVFLHYLIVGGGEPLDSVTCLDTF